MYEVISLDNYKEMYFKMFNAAQDAIELLIKAQQECEELYISGQEKSEACEKQYNDK